jgi:hypothetical protein
MRTQDSVLSGVMGRSSKGILQARRKSIGGFRVEFESEFELRAGLRLD